MVSPRAGLLAAAAALAAGAAGAALYAAAARRARRRPARALAPRTAPPRAADLIMGCSTLAGMYAPIGAAAAAEAVKAAYAAGVRDFDTAPHYGLGLSEERLGIGLKAAGADPRGVRVWSKVGRLVRPLSAIKPGDVLETENMAGEPTCIFPETPRQIAPVLDYTAEGVRASHDDTLARLKGGAAAIEGLRVHDCDSPERYAEAMARGGAVDGLVALRSEGKIKAVSIGLNDSGVALRMVRGKPAGTFDCVMIAGAWNLIDQDGLELMRECQARGIDVHNAGAFASGILVGGSSYKYGKAPDEVNAKVDKWGKLAVKYATPMPVLAIAFALLPAAVSRLAVGLKSPDEVHQAVAWVDQAASVPPELWREAKAHGLIVDGLELP